MQQRDPRLGVGHLGLVPENHTATTFRGIRGMRQAMVMRPLQRDEGRAGPHVAAILNQVGYRQSRHGFGNRAVRQQCGEYHGRIRVDVVRDHQGASSCPAARRVGISGIASGRTLYMRSAELTTRWNTGAATAPP